LTVTYLTALQLDAAAGLLQNTGLAANAALTTAIGTYNSTDPIGNLLSTLANSTLANLSNVTIQSLESLASNTCPALADSLPTGYTTLTVDTTLFTGLLSNTATLYMGQGDLTKFAQALSQAQSYVDLTAIFVNSAINSQTYLGNTFTSMNNTITGDITTVNLATQAFGQDLANLGDLINLNDLGNFGSPLGLIQQIYSVTGAIPSVSIMFVAVGIPVNVVLGLVDPTISVTDSIQRLMYTAMQQITGNDLAQILSVLKVNTVGIETMADLLNPVKLFPNSFQSLTVSGSAFKKPIPIYVNSTGSVNETLKTELPPYVMSSLV